MEIENGENIIVVGKCDGKYSNKSVTKKFNGKVLVSARSDGTVIVHNLENGVRPLCYIDGGAKITIEQEQSVETLTFIAETEDGQLLELTFFEVATTQGIFKETKEGLVMPIIRCVFDMGGKYGRSTISRILMGSVSKKILTINVKKLETYGVVKEYSKERIFATIDWLIESGYLAYVEDSEFPVLVVTAKGLDILNNNIND